MKGVIAEAVDAALAGLLVVLPTDTVYGVGTRPDDPSATARLFDAKRRPRDLELPILAPTVASARRVAVFDERADLIAATLWPGALTLVLPRADAAAGWDLGGDPSTVGVRVPHHPLTLAVLAAAGPLAVTSANRSGEPTPTTCEALHAVFADDVAVYVCEDATRDAIASTVVDLTGRDIRLLRAGAVAFETVTDLFG
jgi:L-threonylcarbamoyladenylate synthase